MSSISVLAVDPVFAPQGVESLDFLSILLELVQQLITGFFIKPSALPLVETQDQPYVFKKKGFHSCPGWLLRNLSTTAVCA